MQTRYPQTFFPGVKYRPYMKFATVADPSRPLELVLGGTLAEVIVAYETYGTLAPEKDNVILVCHALTGDSHCAAHDDRDDEAGGTCWSVPAGRSTLTASLWSAPMCWAAARALPARPRLILPPAVLMP
jgi:hypothetical protein